MKLMLIMRLTTEENHLLFSSTSPPAVMRLLTSLDNGSPSVLALLALVLLEALVHLLHTGFDVGTVLEARDVARRAAA